MRKTFIATAILGALTLPISAHADTAPAAPEAAPASPHTFTANIGLYSDYRFRGITQTFKKPAIQGGFDYAHASGFYLGNWNSNISETAGFPEGNLEMDFYGGFKTSLGDVGLDIGAIYYYYPGTESGSSFYSPTNANTGKTASGAVDNKEIYIGASWKFLSLKYSHSVDDYFSIPDTKNTSYVDLSANFDLGDGWGVNGHAGHLDVDGLSDASYTDWKVGVTKDFGGWLLALAYIDTNAKGNIGEFYRFTKTSSGKTTDGGSGTAVLSISRTF